MTSILGILVLTSSLILIHCFDWCPLIKPNGQYRGLEVYRSFDQRGQYVYWMDNREGKRWTFNMTSNGMITLNKISIITSDGV